MEQNLFGVSSEAQVRKTFGHVASTELTSAQTTALKAVADAYITIGNVMANAKLPGELAELITPFLYQGNAICSDAIVRGWNGGKSYS